ncbi:hypothetical protein HOLleu_15467 [Holothuria leucospilota]|uniref:Uncharacterized protein n=1 Tax=Holothuria leucospilota TaxID=206669 RepID=A0A9Q1CA99_HOLLE|nr:hypothetical protein HOLleu_15467 [Holothuria leucospilota]
MEEGDDPFSKAWETSPQSSTFPGAWSAAPQASGDPWGHKVKEEPWTSENGPEHDHLDERTEGTQQLNAVFQQCNINDAQSAIGNRKNNFHSHSNELNRSGFDDNFGEWSETDVLFKSGLLDQEFKTVSVTAEEDDLWSSADVSALNLSLQSPGFTTQDANQRPVERSQISSIQEEVDVSNIDGSTRGDESSPSSVNVSSTTCLRAENKPSRSVVSQEQDSILSGQVESGQVQLGGDGDIIEGDSSGPSITNSSTNAVTHSMLISTAGSDGSSSVSEQPKVNCTPPSLLGATVPNENTSIIPTQNIDASNSEPSLSVNAGNRNSYSLGEVDKLSDSSLTHTGNKSIPLHISDTALRTFEDSKEKRIMGNILDSDKEEKENMEAVDVDTQDKGEQTMPSDPEDKSAAPTVDLKESVAVKENGSDAMVVNGEQGDNEIPLNDSLDTQTQTQEDEFPPDDDYVEDTQLEAEPEKVVLAEENGVVENQDIIETEDAATSDLPNVIEKEDSSEGYGSQDADKTLDSENGTETIAPAEKEEEKVVSQDEGLASPENEDSNAVSTLESVQTIEGVVERGNVDKGVDLVIVDRSLEFDPNIVSNGDNPDPQGVPEVIGVGDNTGTEQTQGTLELWAENKQTDSNEEERNSETNISSNNYTDQTDIVHDAYTGTQNISDREEGQVTKDRMSGQGDSDDVSERDKLLHSNQNNSVPSKEVDINTTGKGMNEDTETMLQQESVVSNNSQMEPLVEFVQGSENCVGGRPEMNSQSQKEEASDLSLCKLDSEKECSAGISVDVPADIVTGTLGVPQLTEQPLKEPSDKEEGLKVVEGSRYPDNQGEIFQECNTSSEAHKSLDLDKELDINNSEFGKEAIENSELKKTTEIVKPLEENVAEFVDEVLNKAMEQLSSEQTKAISQEDFQENKEVGDAISDGASKEEGDVMDDSHGGAKEEGAVMDDKSNGLVAEVNCFSEEKEFSKDIDVDSNGNVKLNLNLTSETVSEGVSLGYTSGEVDKIEGGAVSVGDQTPEKNTSGHIGSSGSATRSQRWSVPAGSFTNSQFSYADQTTESSTAYVKRETSPLEKRQFRPVRFRPASSSEAKLRRTSLGVPRGWNAPPVDVLLPTDDREDIETVGQTPLEAGPSSLTSDTSTSSGSSMSFQSSQSSEGLRKQGDIFRAEPVMVTADMVEAQDSAPIEVEPKSEKPEDGTLHDSTFDDSTDEKSQHVVSSPLLYSTPSPLEKKANVEEPSVPAKVKRTPPLSQKVEVYEIKDVPITSPPAASMRDTFSQNRSKTEGEGVTRKKISQAERERQEVLAALRVRRPVKEKWQGQIELEEKEKQIQLDEMSLRSLKGYEERKKIKIKSKSLDFSSSGEMSVAKSQEAEAELNNTDSSQESSFEREIRLQKEKESSFKEGQLNRLRHHRPHSLTFDGESGDITQGELYISKEDVLSPNGDTCSSGYTSGRSTPASEDASRLLSLPKHGGPGDSPLYKEYQTQDAEEADDQRLPSREEMGLRPVVPEDPIAETDQQEEPQSPQQKSFVQKEVKMREKKAVNSRVVKQHRISFVEQEVLRQKQQEEEFRREREMRDQERTQALSPSPPSSTSGSNASSRLTSPTTPEPATKPVKAPVKQPPSKAKAVYQELQYNPKVGGGNRSSAMVRQWESKFKK